MLKNNPSAVVVLTPRDFRCVQDTACSVFADGKIIEAAKGGKPIHWDWATDEHGVPTLTPPWQQLNTWARIGGLPELDGTPVPISLERSPVIIIKGRPAQEGAGS
ncbi:MAG: Ldh family oxidoreductase [Deltaproteobacteria bacterium]|nr:Ldh family oxidoreductase [Deltaproteobacteria bacterium]